MHVDYFFIIIFIESTSQFYYFYDNTDAFSLFCLEIH